MRSIPVEPAKSPSASVSGRGFAVSNSSVVPVAQNFRELTERAFAEIPTVAELQALNPEEAHETPRAIVQAGLAIGNVAAAIEANPEQTLEAGLRFYGECANRDNYPDPIRALCFAKGTHLDHEFQNRVEVTGTVRALAARS